MQPWWARAQEVVQQKLQALLEQGLRRVSLQLFWEPEAGGGFSEAASQRRSVMAEEPAMVTVLALRIRSATGTLLSQWPVEQTLPDQEQVLPVRGVNPQTLVLQGGMVLSATADPGVVLDLPADVLQQLEAKAELELEAIWQPLSQELSEVLLEGRK
jgi:hypothetical protein